MEAAAAAELLILMARPHGMEAREFKEYLLPRGPASQGASEFAVGFAVHFFEDFPLPHSPDLLPWELNRGGADSTLRRCKDLTEQRLQLHHLSPSPFLVVQLIVSHGHCSHYPCAVSALSC